MTIVAMHHTNKSNSGSIAASLMGSGGMASVAATILETSRYNDKRQLRSLHRYGREIERTDFYLDQDTGVITLGVSTTERNDMLRVAKVNELERDIISFVTEKGEASRDEIRKSVKGNKHAKDRTSDRLVDKGLFTRTGTGRKGDPYVYNLAAIPTEKAA